MVLTGIRILHVEDNADDAWYVRETLPAAEFPISWVTTAQEAWTELSESRFDLLLLDHGLTDTNGLLFLEQVKSLYPGLPVIVLSGRTDDALGVSSVIKGAAICLHKDEVKEKLCRAVKETLAAGAFAQPGAAEPRTSGRLQRLSQVLLATMNEGCVVIDVDGNITFANEAAGRMVGCDSSDLLGQAVSNFLDKSTARRCQNALRSLLRRDTPAPDSFAFNGTLLFQAMRVPAHFSGRSVCDTLGKYESCLLVLTDISKLAAVRKALHGRILELKRVRRLKDKFMSHVVHDLRAPLALIQGLTQNALDGLFGNVGERQRRPLDIAMRNAVRMERLIGNLLDLTQLEAGVFHLQKRNIDIRIPIRSAADDYRAAHAKSPNSLSVRLPDFPVYAVSDPDRLTQVVLNFLDNAARFAAREIQITLAAEDGEARLTVEDDGPGIPPEDIDRIFDRFACLTAPPRNSRTGLGLSIVRAIVKAHGGDVWVENREESRGARFVVRLPAVTDTGAPGAGRE